MRDYPDMTGGRKRSVLPPALQLNLQRLAKSLADKRPLDAEVAAVVDGLARLPSDIMPSASRDILMCGELFARHHYEKWSGAADGPRKSREVRQLENVHGLEYIFMFHGNGYYRQAALQLIHEPVESPFFIAAILYRLNDWVPEVRREAMICASRAFDRSPAHIIAPAVIGIAGARLQWQRGADEAIVIDEALSRRDVRDAVTAYFLTESNGPALRVLRAFLRDDRIDVSLPDLARHARQPSVRAAALQVLLKGQARWRAGTTKAWIDKAHGLFRQVPNFESRSVTTPLTTGACIRVGASDKSAQVRKVAMQAIVDNPDFWSMADLIDTLKADKSPSIREGIAYILRQKTQSSKE